MLTSALHKLKSVLHQKLQGRKSTWEKNMSVSLERTSKIFQLQWDW